MEAKILKAAALFTDKKSLDTRINYVHVTSFEDNLFVWSTNKSSFFISRVGSDTDVNLRIAPESIASLAKIGRIYVNVGEDECLEAGDVNAKELLLRVGLRQFKHDRDDPSVVSYSAEELNLAAKANKILTGSKGPFYVCPANRPTNTGAVVIEEDVTYVFIMPLSENMERFSKPSWVQE